MFKFCDMKSTGDKIYLICLRDTEVFVDIFKNGEPKYT